MARVKRHPRALLKEAADMVRREADSFQRQTGDESGVAAGFREVARQIERIRLTEDVK